MPVPTATCSAAHTRQNAPFTYRHPDHQALPHVVSFSGGRSSAMLAFTAAKEYLNPDRGDVVLFANTSAEHPGTYGFAAECKHRLETEFGLPVFWYEFTTVEDAWRGEYRRTLTYRLVQPVPVEDHPDGYRSRGELFEELVALQGMLPNAHSRTCTAKLKLWPSHRLLADWLGGTDGPAHAGHHVTDGDGQPVCQVDPDRYADRYAARGGTSERERVLRRAELLARRPPSRPAQRFTDFTTAPVPVRSTQSNPLPVPMGDPQAGAHVRLLGLRADEPNRVDRVLARTLYAEGATGSRCRVPNQPPGEHPYFPLHETGVTVEDVAGYWALPDRRDFDLGIPSEMGNCSFCFMKGTKKMVRLGQAHDPQRVEGTPSDLNWWADFEDTWARHTPSKRNPGATERFGFFGVNDPPLRELITSGSAATAARRYKGGTPACDCTD